LEYQEDIKTDKLWGIGHMKKETVAQCGGWNMISDTVEPEQACRPTPWCWWWCLIIYRLSVHNAELTKYNVYIFQAYGHYQEAALHLRHALELKPEFEPALAALKDMESIPDTTIHIYTLLIIICLVTFRRAVRFSFTDLLKFKETTIYKLHSLHLHICYYFYNFKL
jgi:hypothetical protein